MKKINKRIKILLLILILSIFVYINFITGYYSFDTEKLLSLGYEGYAMQYSLYDGRIFMYVILNIAEILNISIKTFYIILLSLSLFVSSISVLIIYEIIENIKVIKEKKSKYLSFMLSYLYIFNFMYINSMEFVECIIISVSILLFILSAKKIVLDNQPQIGFIICFFGILFYQGTINIFITTAIMFLILKKREDNQNKYELIKKVILIGIITALVVGLDIIIVNIIHLFVESIQGNRLNLNIITNIKQLIFDLPLLINNSLNLFPQLLQRIITTTLIMLAYFYSIKYNKIKEFWTLVILVIVCYLSCLVIGIANNGLVFEGNGRMFNSVGALVSVVIIYMYVKTDIFNNKYLKKIIETIVVLYFIINLLNTIYVTKILKNENKKDEQLSFEIKSQLEENNINKFAIDYIFGEKTTIKLMKSKALMCIYNNYTYEIYTGKKTEKVFFDEKIKEEYFKDKTEKMIVIGDTLYVSIYLDNYIQ